MKKRAVAMVMAAMMAATAFAGCGEKKEEAAAPAASEAKSEAAEETAEEATEEAAPAASAEALNIDVILKTTSAEYWQYVMAGAKAAGEELGVNVDVKGATSETAYDEQLNMIETDLNSGAYDVVIISPLQGDQVATQIAKTDIPVFALDTKINSDQIISFIGTGNEEAAKLGAAAAVEAAREAGWEEIKCIEIAGVQGDETNTARMNGYRAGVNENGGEFLDDEVQYADAVADKAVTSMEAIMQKFPEGVAIICANNDDMAMAAARAAKDNEAYANTIFLGFNGDRAACEAILAGEETMSVIQDAYGMGYKAVQAAVDYLNGAELESFIDSGSGVATMDNAQARLDELKSILG